MKLNKGLIPCVSLLSFCLSWHGDEQLWGAALAAGTAWGKAGQHVGSGLQITGNKKKTEYSSCYWSSVLRFYPGEVLSFSSNSLKTVDFITAPEGWNLNHSPRKTGKYQQWNTRYSVFYLTYLFFLFREKKSWTKQVSWQWQFFVWLGLKDGVILTSHQYLPVKIINPSSGCSGSQVVGAH